MGDERDEVGLHLAHLTFVRHVAEGQGEADRRAGRVLDRSPRPVDGPAAPLELQISLAAEVRILENRAEVVEDAVRVGHRAPATGRALCEAYPDDGTRVEPEPPPRRAGGGPGP